VVALSLPPSPLVGWGGESEGKGKLVGWDKSNLTEQQRENNKKNTDKKNIQCQFSHCLMLSSLLSSKSPYFSQLLYLNTEHGITCCRISHLIAWFGSALLASREN